MGTTSTVNGLPAPADSDGNDVVSDLLALVAVLDTGSVVKRLTSAQIAALSAGQKPAGLVVYNTTTGLVQVSNGSTFDDYAKYSNYADYTPTISQDFATDISKNVQFCRWVQIGKTVHYSGAVGFTGAGYAAAVRVTVPVAPARPCIGGVGWLHWFGQPDQLAQAFVQSVGIDLYIGGTYQAVRSGDFASWSVTYEVA